MLRTKSEELWKKGKDLEINGTSLFSRGPRISVDGFAPKYCARSKDCYFFDVDGERFLDYGMGVGSVILGHGYPMNSIIDQYFNGTNFTLLSPMEVELAEEIKRNIPSCQRMKFLTTGSEATETAVRIARSYTGRDIVIRGHYHGWLSWCSPLPGGIPKCYYDLTIKQQSNNIDDYKKIFDENEDKISCVIIEPTEAEKITKEEKTSFLKDLKTLCEKNGSLLIFDEVACGYRFGVGGAQTFFGVYPHVSVFGKSVSNGIPFSFVGCEAEIGDYVEDKIFVSSTYGSYALGLRACLETTRIVKEKKVSDYTSSAGKKLRDEINKISKENELEDIEIIGFPHRIAWKQTDWDLSSLVFQEFIRRGIFFGWEIKNSYSHKKEHIQETIDKFCEIAKICKKAKNENNVLSLIEGKPIRPIL